MQIAIIGLGSMGKRRLRLIKELSQDVIIYGIDSSEYRQNQVKNEFGIEVFANLETVITKHKLDAVFVCTPPLTHADLILELLEYKINIFSEINLVANKYEDIIKKANNYNCKLFLSSTPMYRKEIQYITQKVTNYKQNLNYIYHIGQYLPDWHPWESYKDFFVGDKRTNGCREIFAIELPWLLNTFGDVQSVSVSKSKNSNLDIDYNDNYIVTLNHDTGHRGVLMVDIISRKATRFLKIIGEELYVEWQGTPDSLNNYDFINNKDNYIIPYNNIEKNINYAQFVIENAYKDEITNFMSYLANIELPKYSFEEDIKTLQLIDDIEA